MPAVPVAFRAWDLGTSRLWMSDEGSHVKIFLCHGASGKDKTQPNGLAGSRSGLFQEVISCAVGRPLGWCPKTSRTCSLSTIAVTSQTVLKPADSGYVGFWRVLDLNISESPGSPWLFFVVAGLGCYPHWSCWLAPVSGIDTSLGLGAATVNASRMDTLPILYWCASAAPESLWVAEISSVAEWRERDG